MTVKTAIIGLGIMGKRMLAQMQAHESFDPVAVFDVNPEACKEASMLAPDAEIAKSAADAMNAADLVYLACPPVPRRVLTLEAAEAGKALFIEKPLGVNLADTEAMVDAIRKSGVPAAVNFTQAAGMALAGVTQSARSGAMGDIAGIDIVVIYAAWPRAWQVEADWLRFRAEGGMTREVLSHFLFFSERILGPLSVSFARPSYPDDPTLCETHLLARLENAKGLPVSILASVGGAQPDRQELTIKGSASSRRITDFYVDAVSDGGPFREITERPADPRATSLRAQLDGLLLCLGGQPHPLATPEEALRVQKLVETMLAA